MRVDGTPYEVMLTGTGYHIFKPVSESHAGRSLSGPFRTRKEALSAAITRASAERSSQSN